jgi:hypothetical protein
MLANNGNRQTHAVAPCPDAMQVFLLRIGISLVVELFSAAPPWRITNLDSAG